MLAVALRLWFIKVTLLLLFPATATHEVDAIRTFFVVGVGRVSVDTRDTREPLSQLSIVMTADGAVARFLDIDGCEVRYPEEAETEVSLLPILSRPGDSVSHSGGKVKASPSQRNLAVLISGHSERFYFSDSGLDTVIAAAKELDFAVDCFVALQTGDMNVPYRQSRCNLFPVDCTYSHQHCSCCRDAGLPYGFSLSNLTSQANNYFVESGARQVSIELFSDVALDSQKQAELSKVKTLELGDRVDQVARILSSPESLAALKQ